MDEGYYIYDPVEERCYSYTQYRGRERIATFASKVEAHVFSTPENAIRTLKSLPCVELHLQVINEYGDIFYDREANYPQKDFLWRNPDDDYETDYFGKMAQ